MDKIIQLPSWQAHFEKDVHRQDGTGQDRRFMHE